jgi:hypothetical protein
MAISPNLDFLPLEELRLDHLNPRLGRRATESNFSQDRILELMKDWKLDELAISFVENGFWPNEALVVVREEVDGIQCNVVVEGNRRLAALILLKRAIEGNPGSRKWADIGAEAELILPTFRAVPVVRADSRTDVEAFLGFRHVTGIKEWEPAEKAEFIARLIDVNDFSYRRVMRMIGSRTETVRRNYISYRILLQMESIEEISIDHVEDRFSVLFLSLRESAVQQFLGIDLNAEPEQARLPVPPERLESLSDFSNWLFGSAERPPLFTDSRDVGRFSRILASDEAVSYLRSTDRPNFEVAYQRAGGDEPDLIERIQTATDEIELALGRIHLFKDSEEVQKVVHRFGLDSVELLSKFPTIWAEIFRESADQEVES